jgi:hypothetical protein
MTMIIDLFNAFSELKVREQIPVIIKEKEYQLVTKIIDQRTKGTDGTGQKITPSYATAYYSKFKNALNPAAGYGIADGKVTGAYNYELHLTIEGENYKIDSDVDYAQSASLLQYGNDFNLPNETSKQEFWDEELAPAILEYIHETIGI